MDLEKRLQNEKAQILDKIELLKEQLKTAPPGNLQYIKRNNQFFYYHVLRDSTGLQKKYISKKESSLLRSLALKKLNSLYLRQAEAEITAIDKYLKYHLSLEKMKEQYDHHIGAGIEALLPDHLTSTDAEQWANASYEKLSYRPTDLKHPTARGEKVRSKSEMIIANSLYSSGIPYRYEALVLIGGEPYYPDFMILHPITQKIVLWEHFGIMDSSEYLERFIQKISTYCRYGYIPSQNLICTFETKNNPLNSNYVATLIQYHFT